MVHKNSLYIFNPEHDLVLGSGEANYMPPAIVRRMAGELALLPLWCAAPGEAVLAPSAYNLDFVRQVDPLLGMGVRLLTEPELMREPHWEFAPWGWNVAVRRRLLALGADAAHLPTTEELMAWREASHRSTAVALLPCLQWDDRFCGESYYLQTSEACRAFVEGQERCLLKAPLSGSGRGLNWCKGLFTPLISDWCLRVSTQQGGVVGEPIYNKVEDFAMEFYSDGDGRVCFVGYSLFRTGSSGKYGGNYLLTDEAVRSRLATYVGMAALDELEERLSSILSAKLGNLYRGYLGVDMMICRFGEEMRTTYRIHPCVEVNLRMTMGLLARLLYNRYLQPGATGEFFLDYFSTEGEVLQRHEELSARYPLVVEDGKLREGYLSLVPVHKRSCYRAGIRVDAPSV